MYLISTPIIIICLALIAASAIYIYNKNSSNKFLTIKVEYYEFGEPSDYYYKTLSVKTCSLKTGDSLQLNDQTKNTFLVASVNRDSIRFTPLKNSLWDMGIIDNVNLDKGRSVINTEFREEELKLNQIWVLQIPSQDAGQGYKITIQK